MARGQTSWLASYTATLRTMASVRSVKIIIHIKSNCDPYHNATGERTVHLHADNCSGQNKNNTMIHYLLWRSMTNRHTDVTLSFLVVGHTKFSPDWCFGLVKRLYRRTVIGSLKDIAEVKLIITNSYWVHCCTLLHVRVYCVCILSLKLCTH